MRETADERRARWRSVSIAPSATPSRTGGAEAKRIGDTEARWDKDMPAYKRLRHDGLQPPRIDGAAATERHAINEAEVEAGHALAPAQLEERAMAEEMA